MISSEIKKEYFKEVESELKTNILPFWIKNTVDKENGGFYGLIADDLNVDKKAHKGCILNSRILWTYSCAYKIYGNKDYMEMANHALDFMMNHFWDKAYSGLYWMVDYRGNVVNDRKQIYNIAFGIYGLTEYYRATGNKDSLDRAIELFRLMEKHSYDSKNKGYIEACSRDWSPIGDMRLSPKEINCAKTMNTHLHILEAYTNLLRVWNVDEMKSVLRELINVTIDHIVDPETYHFKLFFDMEWKSLSRHVSYGHDIEGSWLLFEAAEVLGDKELIEKARDISVKMAESTYNEGVDNEFGGLLYESDGKIITDSSKQWWPHAEAMVGFYNAFELSNKDYYFETSFNMWRYTDKYLVDKKYGEWFDMVTREGKHNPSIKVEPWKCPYHNARACFEIMGRLRK